MNSNGDRKSGTEHGRRLADLRSGSRSSRHVPATRKGTRRDKVERELRTYR